MTDQLLTHSYLASDNWNIVDIDYENIFENYNLNDNYLHNTDEIPKRCICNRKIQYYFPITYNNEIKYIGPNCARYMIKHHLTDTTIDVNYLIGIIKRRYRRKHKVSKNICADCKLKAKLTNQYCDNCINYHLCPTCLVNVPYFKSYICNECYHAGYIPNGKYKGSHCYDVFENDKLYTNWTLQQPSKGWIAIFQDKYRNS